MNPLAEFKKNITSQWGEDGIIAEIFRRIGTSSKRCVEFGAWDGKHLSNTWTLWHDSGWKAVLIEGNPKRVVEMRQAFSLYKNVLINEAWVSHAGHNKLDTLLQRLIPNQSVDLLCIDVDGDDYHIFSSLSNYLPRVLIIEYNPTIPPHIWAVQEPDEYFGASAKAVCELAEEKEYELVAITETNCIFVQKEEFEKLEIPQLQLVDVFPTAHLMPLISSFDGVLFTVNKMSYANLEQSPRSRHLPRFKSTQPWQSVVVKRNLSMLKMIKRCVKKTIKAILSVFGLSSVVSKYYLRLYRQWSVFKQNQLHRRKQRALLTLGKKFKLSTLIETGTYFGDMVDAMKPHFKTIHSIELDKELFSRAQERFASDQHIHLFQGDSTLILPRLLETIDTPCLFWLDGHYSGGVTAKGEKETPILQELHAILHHCIHAHVILIDDMQCFTGIHDYPTVEELKSKIDSSEKYRTKIIKNMMVVFPKHSSFKPPLQPQAQHEERPELA